MKWQGKRSIHIVTACMDPEGCPTFAMNEVEVTQQEYENGEHYVLNEDQLHDAGLEEPFVHFDEFEAPAFLHPMVRQLIKMQADPNYFAEERA